MDKYKKLLNCINTIQIHLVTAILFIMVVINLVEIFSRNFFMISFIWVQELSIILLVWMVFMGAAYIYSKQSLIYVEAIYSRLKGLSRLILDIVVHIVSLFVLCIFIIYGIKYGINQLSSVTNALRIPFTIYSLPLILSSISMVMTMIVKVDDFVKQYKLEIREGH